MTMQAPQTQRAVAAAVSTAASLGLNVDDVAVLHESNKFALRLLPCDVLARVAPVEQQVARFEIDVSQRLAALGSPVAVVEPRVPPRVYDHDGFVITLWTFYESVVSHEVPPGDYADALERLHAGMREVEIAAPHFTDRVEDAQQLLASRDLTPELAEPDRRLLRDTLYGLGRAIADGGRPEQLLHGEPHPGNLLAAKDGLRFIDFETCCRGPVEFDLAHAPESVGGHYPGADQELLRQCRLLMLAMITTWRWDRDDRFPDGRRLGVEWLGRLRSALAGNTEINLYG